MIDTEDKSSVISMLSIFDTSARFSTSKRISVYNYYTHQAETFEYSKGMRIANILNSAGIYKTSINGTYFSKIWCEETSSYNYSVFTKNKYQDYLGITNQQIQDMILQFTVSDIMYLENRCYVGDDSVKKLFRDFLVTHSVSNTYDSLYQLYVFKNNYANYQKILTRLNVSQNEIDLYELSFRMGESNNTLSQLEYQQQQQFIDIREQLIGLMGTVIAGALMYGTNVSPIYSEDSALDMLEAKGYINSTQSKILATKWNIINTGVKAQFVYGEGFTSYTAFKRAAGLLPSGFEYHHIVEQCQANPHRAGFDSQLINNTGNIIVIDSDIHSEISKYYSSSLSFTNGKTVRDWLNNQSFQE